MWPNNQSKEETSKSITSEGCITTVDDINTASTDELNRIELSNSEKNLNKECNASGPDEQVIKGRSASRDSSLNEDPKSLVDSISAASGRQNWSGKELAEDDPSVSSIKGDSVSATIADYNRKHCTQAHDNQSKTSATRLGIDNDGLCQRTDDLSSNINFYSAGGSTSCGIGCGNQGNNQKPGDFISVSSNANPDAFDVIEESSSACCDDNSNQSTSSNINHERQHHHHHHHQRSKRHEHIKRQRASVLEQVLDTDDLPQDVAIYQIEPIIVRGNGNLTLFGLSNSFSPEFPTALIGRVSKEEFDRTMRRINSLLRDQQSLSAKLLLFGGLCCCCSLGFSLVWPSIALKKRSKMCIQKFLVSENSRLYSKLGLNWRLAEQRCYSNHAFVEYVLMIEFIPKIDLYLPD